MAQIRDIIQQPSLSTSPVRPRYEVVLSFRGVDTLEHLAFPLFAGLTAAGISVFTAGGIDPALDEAIGRSKISIPIISPEYASRKSCLMVLAKMVECKDTMNHAIVPIFYRLNPSFPDHRKRGSDGMLVDPLKSALHRIGQSEGYRVDFASNPLISELVFYVTRQLKKAELVGICMPVGIHNQVCEMMTRLDVDYRNGQAVDIRGNEVRTVGVHGIEGIGKTTLVKFVYNQLCPLFEGCSYLGNIRQISRTEPLEHLQSQLVSDLLKQKPITFRSLEECRRVRRACRCYIGIYHIRHKFRNMRVLIVLDDVNERHHLQAFAGKLSWFGSRSRIIVTTRNPNLLNIPEVVETYEVEPMDADQSLRLFCGHAFGGSSPREGFRELSKDIVSTARGLPIAIEVVGSFLYRKDKQIWTETSKKLKKGPVHPVQQVLMTSLDAQDPGTKEIFLDIACFLIGKDKRMPFYMWEGCDFHPCSGVETLLLMSLVKIRENNELLVNDLLRDLGRAIVCKEDPADPGKCSRLWDHKDALYTLRRKRGTKRVQALCLKVDNGSDKCFTCDEFQSLSQLRFLKLDDAIIQGDFTNLLCNLRWLDWRGCPATFEAINLHLENLVILDLSGSKMPRLKVLNLTQCTEMLITPNFSGYPLLEMLILECCFQLVKLDNAICQLSFLVSLNLKSCNDLNVLPQEMGNTEVLKELLIDGTSIREIPESIARMEKLEILTASNCSSLTYLSKSICYIEALSMLLLDNVKIPKLPDSIGSLVKLKQLSLRDCRRIQKLPESIGKLGCSLVELDISGTPISELPDSKRNLQRLRVLKMERCPVREFPSAIGELRKLEEIHASHCTSFEGSIPNDIHNLQFLKILILGHSGVSRLPQSIRSLNRLQTLDLLPCNNLEMLPMLPPSLTCLRISSKKMSIIPDIQCLVELEELSFGDENPKELIIPRNPTSITTKQKFLWPVTFPKLRSLELSHSQIRNLRFEYGSACVPQLKIVFPRCTNLQGVSGLPSLLSVLSIRACSSLTSLPTVQNLSHLLELELSNTAVKEILGLGGLKSLQILLVSDCEIVHLSGLSELRSLKRLSLKNCKSLKLPNVSGLTMLKVLEIHRCQKIHNIEGLEELTSLEELLVSECKAAKSYEVRRAQRSIGKSLRTSSP